MKKLLRPSLALLLLVTAVSCGKDNDTKPEPEPEQPSGVQTGVYSHINLVADSAGTFASGSKPFYFSLEENKIIPESQAQTANWDICFNGTYNSNLCANNGTISTSPGFGGPGKGAIYMVTDAAIDAQYYKGPGEPITKVPERALFDQMFASVKSADVATDDKWEKDAIVGLDYFIGGEAGWAWYDFYGELFPNKPNGDVAHVAYALPRTMILRTAKGKYAKVQVYSFYKDAPAIPDRKNKPGFITLKFAIQKDGSKNLDIKE